MQQIKRKVAATSVVDRGAFTGTQVTCITRTTRTMHEQDCTYSSVVKTYDQLGDHACQQWAQFMESPEITIDPARLSIRLRLAFAYTAQDGETRYVVDDPTDIGADPVIWQVSAC